MAKFGRILVVDDNRDILFTLNKQLALYSEVIKVALTPEKAVELCQKFKPDIVLMDMNFSRDAVSGGDNFSTSYIQRTYEVGFVRAGRIMLQLERAGIVGPQVPGAKSRDVKITDPYALEAKLQELGVE